MLSGRCPLNLLKLNSQKCIFEYSKIFQLGFGTLLFIINTTKLSYLFDSKLSPLNNKNYKRKNIYLFTCNFYFYISTYSPKSIKSSFTFPI